MDQIALQKIATSMSIGDFRSVNRNRLAVEVSTLEPVLGDNVELLIEIMDELQIRTDVGHDSGETEDVYSSIEEFVEIASSFDFQALIEAHDLIANKTCLEPCLSGFDNIVEEVSNSNPVSARSHVPHEDCGSRVINITRVSDSDLGVTYRCVDGKVIVGRILANGLVDRQGMLHVGDVISEVNGQPVKNVTELEAAVGNEETLTLTVVPSWFDRTKPLPTYMKAFFSYNAQMDKLLPSRSLGLSFSRGEILEVLDVNDDRFWQARKLGETGTARLIPSLELQEIREARARSPVFQNGAVWPDDKHAHIRIRKWKKLMYGQKPNDALEIDRHELNLYEEVVQMPPFHRKCIVFLGPSGTSRRKLISELMKMYPDQYGYPVPHTSRSPKPGEINGKNYFFTSRAEMLADINANRYLEHGEYGGHYYGTKSGTIRNILKSGKTCLLDCGPQCLKIIRTREFLPYVVFAGVPDFRSLNTHMGNGTTERYSTALRSRTMENLKQDPRQDSKSADTVRILLQVYGPFMDLVLMQDNFEDAFYALLKAIEKTEREEQWIPADWIYSD